MHTYTHSPHTELSFPDNCGDKGRVAPVEQHLGMPCEGKNGLFGESSVWKLLPLGQPGHLTVTVPTVIYEQLLWARHLVSMILHHQADVGQIGPLS